MNPVYRNQYCAKCNGIPPDEVKCVSIFFSFTRSSDGFLFALDNKGFIFSDLFNVENNCSANEIHDPIENNCVIINNNSSNPWELIIFESLMILSLVALALHMMIFLMLPKQRNLHTKNLFTMSMCLFWGSLLLIISSHFCSGTAGCYVSTVLVFYLLLCSFFWMNVMSYDICKTFRKTQLRGNSNKMYLKYAAYAFIFPFLWVTITVIVDLSLPLANSFSPGFSNNQFWFGSKASVITYFAVPSEVIFLANLTMFSISIYDIFQHQKKTQIIKDSKTQGNKIKSDAQPKKFTATEATNLNDFQTKMKDGIDKMSVDIKQLKLNCKLALIMGIPWVFAPFDEISEICKYLFNILNSLQGVFIFIAFDCNRKVFHNVVEVIRIGQRDTLGSSCRTLESNTLSTTQHSTSVKSL